MKILKYTLQMAVAVSITTGADCWAGDNAKPVPVVVTLSSVPNAALPVKAAQLIAQADFIHQAEVTADVVKAALDVNPGSTLKVVETVSRTVPSMAADAALAAVSRYPSQAPQIAAAAAKGAPAMSGEIVTVLCRAQPYSYRAIAEAVAMIAPGATKDILAAVATAFPSMRATIAQVEAMHAGGTTSVYEVLAEVGDYVQVAGVSSQTSLPHAIGSVPAPNPPSSLPGPVITSTGPVVPAGGRHDSTLP